MDKPMARFTEEVEVNGRKYTLTHPGMRYLHRWRRECSEINAETKLTSFNMEKYLDLAFENCVEPIEHNFYPNQDNIQTPKEQGDWTRLLSTFLSEGSVSDFLRKKEKQRVKKEG